MFKTVINKPCSFRKSSRPLLSAADASVRRAKEPQRRIGALAAAAALLLLVCGCSGTGSMYTPEESEYAYSGSTAADFGASAEKAALHTEAEAPDSASQEEDRSRLSWIGGTGSDLYSAQTVDSYYRFTLDGASFQLPCSTSSLTSAGWELVPAGQEEGGAKALVAPCSYEFFDAVPAGSASPKKGDDTHRIRLCLGNDSKNALEPDMCTVFGISVSSESGVSFKSAFEAGLGSPLSDLTTVFGTDASVLTQTKYSDGTCTACYRFSNGLTEDEKIPVLAEAEEKDLAEMMLAQTGSDGATITSLSLYYFRISK